MFYGSLRYFIILAAAQYIFLYYNVLLSNAQISLKSAAAWILMGVCPCLEDGSSDVPASLSVMHWRLWFHNLPDKVAIIKGWLLSLHVFWHWKLLILKAYIHRERRGASTYSRGLQGKKEQRANQHLSLMICTWVRHPFRPSSGIPGCSSTAGAKLCVSASQTH